MSEVISIHSSTRGSRNPHVVPICTTRHLYRPYPNHANFKSFLQLHQLKSTKVWQFCASAAGENQLDWKSSIKAAVRIAIYIIFLTFYVRFYNMYLNDLAWFAITEVNGNTWNFGQVFAITVWVPPVVEYIHLEMRKLIPFSLDQGYSFLRI